MKRDEASRTAALSATFVNAASRPHFSVGDEDRSQLSVSHYRVFSRSIWRHLFHRRNQVKRPGGYSLMLRGPPVRVLTIWFRVKKGSEDAFEKVWVGRDSYLDRIPGFLEFHLLKGPEAEDHTLYSSHI